MAYQGSDTCLLTGNLSFASSLKQTNGIKKNYETMSHYLFIDMKSNLRPIFKCLYRPAISAIQSINQNNIGSML